MNPTTPLPQAEYRLPILKALRDLKGAGTRSDVLERVEKMLESRFTDADYEYYRKSGRVIWETRASFERVAMIRDGLLKKRAQYGRWELSDDFIASIVQKTNSRKV